MGKRGISSAINDLAPPPLLSSATEKSILKKCLPRLSQNGEVPSGRRNPLSSAQITSGSRSIKLAANSRRPFDSSFPLLPLR